MTPAFISADQSFAAVRYYTPFDPYFYTVDNRPLGDLALNDSTLGSGVDASRRAVLIKSLGDSVFYQDYFGSSRYITGLAVSSPVSGTVRIGIGAVYEPLDINSSDSRQIIKQAILPYNKDFDSAITAPGAGNKRWYLVQGKYSDIDSNTSASFPYFSSTSTLLPSTSLFGELDITIKAGNVTLLAAGDDIPTPDAGYFALYNLYTAENSTAITVTANSSAPLMYGLNRFIPRTVYLNGAANGNVGVCPVINFSDTGTQETSFVIPVDATLNPYKPLVISLKYIAASGGTTSFKVYNKYGVSAATDNLSSLSLTTNATETISHTAATNVLTAYSFTNKVPANAWSGKDNIHIVIGRDSTDTNTGIMSVSEISVSQ
jgi:hypothetical protein